MTEPEKLELSITSLDLPVRTANTLQKNGVYTIADLLNQTKDRLCEIGNLGPRSLEDILAALDKVGFHAARQPARKCRNCGKSIRPTKVTGRFCGRRCYVTSITGKPKRTPRLNGHNGKNGK